MATGGKTASAKNLNELAAQLTEPDLQAARKPAKKPAAVQQLGLSMDLPRDPAKIALLCELAEGQEADFFALLSEKQELKTRDGKPYHRVTFRDAKRDVSFPIWSDSPLGDSCRDEWSAGSFFKMRALFRQTTYGPQLDIKKI